MPSRRQVLRRLFSKGLVSDVDTSDLAPDMAEALQDVVWTANGDLSKRGGFLYATGANPVNANTSTLVGVFLYPVEDAFFPDTFTYKLLVVDSAGRMGVIGSYTYAYGTANTSTTSTVAQIITAGQPVLLWQNEVVFVSDTSRSLSRWGGSTGTEDASPTGTVSATIGQDVLTGVGTAFSTEVTAGQYVNISDANEVITSYLVEKVESNTRLRVSAPFQVAFSGSTFDVTNFGRINVSSLVTAKGIVSSAAAVATGQGTTWDTGLDAADRGSFNFSDWIVARDSTQRVGISDVASDTSLNLLGTPSPAWSDDEYVIGRQLTGNVVCSHAGRLWVAGVPWAPNRLQVTPVGHNLSDVFNGVDSSTTNPADAAVIESVDVPDNSSPGYITALASGNDPGPLVICRDRDAYIAYGEWPSIQITKLGDDIGCSNWQGITFHGRSFYWAGLEGVFTYTPGGGVRNLMAGRIYREWKALVTSQGLPVQTIVAVVNRTLFVSVSAAGTSIAGYMMDLEREAWSTFTDFGWSSASEVVFAGVGRDVFVTEKGTNRVVSLRSATEPTYAGVANSLQGVFLARSGRMLLGQAGDLGRIIDAKITYRLTGTSSPAFTIRFGSVTLDTAATVSTTTSGAAYNTVRFRPGSTLMGTNVRDVQVEFTESAGTLTRLELNEFSWVARLRRPRA